MVCVKSGLESLKFPILIVGQISFPSLNQTILLLGFFLGLGGLLGRSIKYNRYNVIKNTPINIYNNSSTLLYKYHLRAKRIHPQGGFDVFAGPTPTLSTPLLLYYLYSIVFQSQVSSVIAQCYSVFNTILIDIISIEFIQFYFYNI